MYVSSVSINVGKASVTPRNTPLSSAKVSCIFEHVGGTPSYARERYVRRLVRLDCSDWSSSCHHSRVLGLKRRSIIVIHSKWHDLNICSHQIFHGLNVVNVFVSVFIPFTIPVKVVTGFRRRRFSDRALASRGDSPYISPVVSRRASIALRVR